MVKMFTKIFRVIICSIVIVELIKLIKDLEICNSRIARRNKWVLTIFIYPDFISGIVDFLLAFSF